MAEDEEEEVEEGEEKPVEEEKPPPPSKIQINLAENAKFVASNLDDLFALVAKIQADMVELENRLRTEFDEKIRVHHEIAMARIVALDELCAIHGIRLDEHKKRLDQQAMQLDDLQNQVGILYFRFH